MYTFSRTGASVSSQHLTLFDSIGYSCCCRRYNHVYAFPISLCGDGVGCYCSGPHVHGQRDWHNGGGGLFVSGAVIGEHWDQRRRSLGIPPSLPQRSDEIAPVAAISARDSPSGHLQLSPPPHPAPDRSSSARRSARHHSHPPLAGGGSSCCTATAAARLQLFCCARTHSGSGVTGPHRE
jgi:hypothetical protein